MATAIDNPILNSPFNEPVRHWRFDEDGITDEIVESRRGSEFFMPIPAAKRSAAAQQELAYDEFTSDRIVPAKFVDELRHEIGKWRFQRWPGVTATTRALLAHWTDPERERRLFFCQVEAVETAIWLTEVAPKDGHGRFVLSELQRFAEDANPGVFRVAHKMATGTGKTAVMAMLIAWQTLNKAANPQDGRFSDAFLVVAPGITIKDRLRVLLPEDVENSYRVLDLVPPQMRDELGRAQIVITNFHAFKQRERVSQTKATKQILGSDDVGAFTETPAQMVNRVCKALRGKRNIVVLNDEAHHCYQRRPDGVDEKLTGDERKEAAQREEDARQWLTGIRAVADKLGVRMVYDLSATPFFLRGSGYAEGTLFPWVVSDFGLIDAIEAGLVKVPRVPVEDDALGADGPTYRVLWKRIKDELPKGTRKAGRSLDPDRLPLELQGAIQSLYRNYERSFRSWEASDAALDGATPPVFIVVCNNTNVSKLVYDHIAGYEKLDDDGEPMRTPDGQPVLVPGACELFSNVVDGRWCRKPLTILVDSRQLDSGEAMTADFKTAASIEIEEFHHEYRQRYPGADVDKLTDEDLLREVMNTVGSPGRLGADVRCVVSVSMLTEGWDANTVTHILGVRAFGTQLLCEQVVGRGLRRRSFALDDDGHFPPEYAEVYGVPFSFIRSEGVGADPAPVKRPTRVRALPERASLAMTFPRLAGYRYEAPDEIVFEGFDADSHMVLTPADLPTTTQVEGVVGEKTEHTLDELRALRPQTIAFELARVVLDRYFRTDSWPEGPIDRDDVPPPSGTRPWMFPKLVPIARAWLDECLSCKGGTFPGLLVMHRHREEAATKIFHSIVRAEPGDARLLPVLRAYDPIGSTAGVDFDTTKDTRPTDPERCHVSHTVADSGWEFAVDQALESHPKVLRYVKNQGVGFTIPYVFDGRPRDYVPDFLVDLDDGGGPDGPLHLVVEVSGERDRSKQARVDAARTLWIPAVNSAERFGRWRFVEVTDPYATDDLLDAIVAERSPVGAT